jgi:hypothetical protein
MGVSIRPGDKDIANNFVDVDNCSSSGLVTGDDDKQLFAWYCFAAAESRWQRHCNYNNGQQEGGVCLPRCESWRLYSEGNKSISRIPLNISYYVTDPDGDNADSKKDKKVDNSIGVLLQLGEKHVLNNAFLTWDEAIAKRWCRYALCMRHCTYHLPLALATRIPTAVTKP